MLAKEIKPGAVVKFEGSPVIVESVQVQTPSARGAATLYKYRARNLVTRSKVDITLKGTESLEDADFQRRDVKLMYADATHVHLLDQADYNQYSVELADVSEQMGYVTEALEGIQALIYEDECVGMQLPTTVELTITQTEPAVKGNSATSRNKPATLETGIEVMVPEYIPEGTKVKVDTRTGTYISRA